MPNGRKTQQKIDDQTADWELANGKNHQRGGMPLKMPLEPAQARPVTQNKILTTPSDKQEQGIIARERGCLRPKETVPEPKGEAAYRTEE